MTRTVLATLALFYTIAHADTIYLCRAYDGNRFWSNEHCRERNALIERMQYAAPGPLHQQAQQANTDLQRTYDQQARDRIATQSQASLGVMGPNASPACKSLDEKVRWIDEQARRPQSAYTQMRLAEQRKAARDQRFRLGC